MDYGKNPPALGSLTEHTRINETCQCTMLHRLRIHDW